MIAAAARAVVALGLAASWLLVPHAGPVRAAGSVTLDAHAQLAGHVRPGAWAEVDVLISNDGPSLTGELRVRTQVSGASQFGVAADLASGAHKEYWLYAQPPLFGSKLSIDFVVGSETVATKDIAIKSHDAYSPIIAVVAEHPEGFLRDVTSAAAPNPQFGGPQTTVITLTPADLPRRVDAWSAIDRLVWQDVDTGKLSPEQLAALQLWVAAGGRLILLGGTIGPSALAALPDAFLPFRPTGTIDVPTADLTSLLGRLPTGAASAPALAGTLNRGTVMGRSGNYVYAVQAPWGQGQVAIIGLNPAETWLTRSTAADTLWHRLLPSATGPTISPFILVDDSSLLNVLQTLPAVALPPIETLFLLLFAYIALIGPLNYLVLRRLDKREWAWVTMPALVAIFAVGSYGVGASLKGSDVIVNELSIVRAGQGTDQGRAQSYIGVYSPSRKTFEVRIANGALLSSTIYASQTGQTEQPLDVLIGESTSRLRNFEVGFGVLRGFRAEAPASAPKIDASLSLKNGRVTGTITNSSTAALENVAVIFAGTVAVKPALAPGETWTLDVSPDSSTQFGYQLSERIFGSSFPSDPTEQRKLQNRRSVVDVLSQGGTTIAGTPTDVPLLLGWQAIPALDVELTGDTPTRVGDSLFLIPLSMTFDAQALFVDPLMLKTIVDSSSADQAWFDGQGFNLGRGTMTIEARPAGLSGTFATTSLELALTSGGFISMSGTGKPIEPLAAAQQPNQDDPVGTGVDGGSGNVIPPTNGGGDSSGGGATGAAGGTDGSTPSASEATAPAATPAPEPTVGPMPPGFPGKPEQPCCGEGVWDPLPDLQLFNFSDGKWYEFAHFDMSSSYVIKDAQRYVDTNGRILVRLVNRSNQGDSKSFQLLARLEGTVQ
jgi:hypothetical protein